MDNCPCGSQQLYQNCCEPFLLEKKSPATPEALMRSRYTAYTLAKIDYIQNTMQGKASKNYDPVSAKVWAQSISWLGLTVISAPTPTKDTGTVTFIARFHENNKPNAIYECSQFQKINGRWFYVDGATPKIQRNAPCPCGSQKKAKRCCF